MIPTNSASAQADTPSLPGGNTWLWLCVASFIAYCLFSEALRGDVAFLIRAAFKVFEHLA